MVGFYFLSTILVTLLQAGLASRFVAHHPLLPRTKLVHDQLVAASANATERQAGGAKREMEKMLEGLASMQYPAGAPMAPMHHPSATKHLVSTVTERSKARAAKQRSKRKENKLRTRRAPSAVPEETCSSQGSSSRNSQNTTDISGAGTSLPRVSILESSSQQLFLQCPEIEEIEDSESEEWDGAEGEEEEGSSRHYT